MGIISDGRNFALLGLFALQALCVVLLSGEAVVDVFGGESPVGVPDSDAFEYLIVAALFLGLLATGREIWKVLGRQKRMETQMMAASGAFAQLLEEHFDTWGLTPSERDVALFAMKGLSIAEIADMRQTREGTVKAQCNAIYRKAGVSGRPQLLSLFIEELMTGTLVQPDAAPANSAATGTA